MNGRDGGSGLSDAEGTDDRIRARLGRGEFLANLLRVAATDSQDVQEHFVQETSTFTRRLRGILDNHGMIRQIDYRPGAYWPGQRGKLFGFIDGGVANIEIPTAAPVGIRVGSYVVRPGDETKDREEFNIEIAIVDDLFGPNAMLYSSDESDDSFSDLMKLRDAARIISESAAALRLMLRTERRPDGIVLHGPLINPAAPYGLEKFPPLQASAARKFLGDDAWEGDRAERGFVRLELEVLRRMMATGVPVVGVVERAKAGKHPFFLTVLQHLMDLPSTEALKSRHASELAGTAEAFGLNDTTIFDLVLRAGEYLSPVPVNRQGDEHKWPKHGGLNDWIWQYPPALTTYLKPTDTTQPFRVEGFEGNASYDDLIALVLHTSRLLPFYVFPVGLDIADRFAKVPSWMSAGIRSRHQVTLLRKAIESGDPRVIAYAKRVMASKGRDWLFRPTI